MCKEVYVVAIFSELNDKSAFKIKQSRNLIRYEAAAIATGLILKILLEETKEFFTRIFGKKKWEKDFSWKMTKNLCVFLRESGFLFIHKILV